MGMKRILLLAAVAGPMLSGCLWLNTLFNGRKALETAERDRERRFRKNPLDTVDVSPDEKAQYQRAIAKGSKVLELWPNDSSWHPEALIVIGKSQQRLSDFDKAYRTYGAIVDGYPGSKREMPAIQGIVECLLALGRFAEASEWMKRLDSLRIEGGPAGLAWMRAQLALGRMDTATARRELGRILSIPDAPATRKAEAAWLSGILAWAQADWNASREAFLRPEIQHLPYSRRFQARLKATLALDRDGRTRDAVAELRGLLVDTRYSRSLAELLLELGRLEFANGWHAEAIQDLARLEKLLDPPDKVAEGLVMLGDDARLRRIDLREALRVYQIGAKAGGNTFWGNRARELANALSDLASIRERKVSDTGWSRWNFDLAELYLLRLGGRDSARAAYGRVLSDTAAAPLQKARAGYALAWISDDERGDSGAFDPAPWLKVATDWPGTEFAKVAQRNAGVEVTTVTRQDSAELDYRSAERKWMDDSAPQAAIELFQAVAAKYRETIPGKKALFAMGWIHDNLRHDSAKAAAAYKIVVDSLPGTQWATRADAILKGNARDFLEGVTRTGPSEEDFEEGLERLEEGGRKLAPKPSQLPALSSPDEPEAIPPPAEDQYFNPEDFN